MSGRRQDIEKVRGLRNNPNRGELARAEDRLRDGRGTKKIKSKRVKPVEEAGKKRLINNKDNKVAIDVNNDDEGNIDTNSKLNNVGGSIRNRLKFNPFSLKQSQNFMMDTLVDEGLTQGKKFMTGGGSAAKMLDSVVGTDKQSRFIKKKMPPQTKVFLWVSGLLVFCLSWLFVVIVVLLIAFGAAAVLMDDKDDGNSLPIDREHTKLVVVADEVTVSDIDNNLHRLSDRFC
ncbi:MULTISPECIES: hypothetical protein [Bacillus amyloliquefaciens group]|uniref:hypothetical protein n=1 Tax=Bacillus amyloliquefaciens group TaxID=1938374 RepID=UPI00073C21BE|nr:MULTISPECIES: hypothetical protein [Bacillus amyloliquefaciens group]KTF59740.1 hypothetical protein AR691_13485 [Bacillus amyloliquefaciens]